MLTHLFLQVDHLQTQRGQVLVDKVQNGLEKEQLWQCNFIHVAEHLIQSDIQGGFEPVTDTSCFAVKCSTVELFTFTFIHLADALIQSDLQ